MNPFREIISALSPAVSKKRQRGIHPQYLQRPATGILDADLLHSQIAQAKAGNMTPLLSTYREIEMADDAIGSSLASRKLATLSDTPGIQPARKGVLADQAAADAFQRAIDNSPTYLEGCKHWLNACLWPVAVNSVRWLASSTGYHGFELRPVPLEQLDYTEHSLRITKVTPEGVLISGQSEYPDPARYIVHRGHLSSAPDQWGGPFRALVFWHLFGACSRDWFVRFLERFMAPFMVGRYDPDDEESRANLEIAFSQAAQTFGIVTTSDTAIELHEAKSAVGSASFESFHNIAERAKIRVILGQTLSAKNDSSGLGSGNAGLQGQVRTEYRTWDRLQLAATIRSGLIRPFMDINRLPGECPRLQFPGDPADLAQIGSFLQTAASAGLEVDDLGLEALNGQTGITLRRLASTDPRPDPHQLASLQAALAASAVPGGVIATGALTRNASAAVLRALRQDHAGVSQILRRSATLDDLMQGLEAHFASIHSPALAATLAEVSAAAAANAKL